MTLRPRLLAAITTALQSVLRDHHYADRALESSLRDGPDWDDAERAFIAQTTYAVLRRYRMLTELLGRKPQSPEGWTRLTGICLALEGGSLPKWDEFQGLDPRNLRRRAGELGRDRRLRESIPDWLDNLGMRELGDQWPPTIAALNRPPDTILRTNRLKTDPNKLRKALRRESIETEPIAEDALLVTERRHLFSTQAFRDGWFEIQDYASQQVAPFLRAEPGMTVIDACAGAGGKTLHLSALMQNRGRLLALDTEAHKLDDLKERARRAGATNIIPRPITSTKTVKRLDGQADRLLLDVPCSGLGVLRRNPDARWHLTPQQLQQLREAQAHILSYYPRMLKPGGLLAYVTCSVLPSENEEQVQAFLKKKEGQFKLVEEKRLWPQAEGFDGFYMALLEKV